VEATKGDKKQHLARPDKGQKRQKKAKSGGQFCQVALTSEDSNPLPLTGYCGRFCQVLAGFFEPVCGSVFHASILKSLIGSDLLRIIQKPLESSAVRSTDNTPRYFLRNSIPNHLLLLFFPLLAFCHVSTYYLHGLLPLRTVLCTRIIIYVRARCSLPAGVGAWPQGRVAESSRFQAAQSGAATHRDGPYTGGPWPVDRHGSRRS
jgi:hypothetical protein